MRNLRSGSGFTTLRAVTISQIPPAWGHSNSQSPTFSSWTAQPSEMHTSRELEGALSRAADGRSGVAATPEIFKASISAAAVAVDLVAHRIL